MIRRKFFGTIVGVCAAIGAMAFGKTTAEARPPKANKRQKLKRFFRRTVRRSAEGRSLTSYREIKFEDIKAGDRLIVVGIDEENGLLNTVESWVAVGAPIPTKWHGPSIVLVSEVTVWAKSEDDLLKPGEQGE